MTWDPTAPALVGLGWPSPSRWRNYSGERWLAWLVFSHLAGSAGWGNDHVDAAS